METKITKLLGIKYPIICGAMGYIGVGELPAAVSNAGGAGVIGAGATPAEVLLGEVKRTRSLTNKPFGINIPVKANPNYESTLEIICQEKPAFITIGNGDPRDVIKRVKAASKDIMILPVVPNLKLAKRMDELKVDGIIVEGQEAGGHVGYSTTMANMSIILPQIKNIPVVAAGGFADGRGLAAALLMGASAIQMGTVFLFAPECPIHDNARKVFIEADDTATVVTGHSIKDGVRGIKNAFTEKFLEKEFNGAPMEELIKLGTGSYRRGMIEGDVVNGSLAPGIVVGKFNKMRSVKEIIDSIMQEAEEALKNAHNLAN